MKNFLGYGSAVICISSLVFTPTFFENSKLHDISPEQISTILDFAKVELTTKETFLHGLDDIELVLAQEDVLNVLRGNENVDSKLKKLKLADSLAQLLRDAYKSTRNENGAGFAFKEDVARLLMIMYQNLSERDQLKKINCHLWAEELFKEINAANKPKDFNAVASANLTEKSTSKKDVSQYAAAEKITNSVAEKYSHDLARNVAPKERRDVKRRTMPARATKKAIGNSPAEERGSYEATTDRKKPRKRASSAPVEQADKVTVAKLDNSNRKRGKTLNVRKENLATKNSDAESPSAKSRRRKNTGATSDEIEENHNLVRPTAKPVVKDGRKERMPQGKTSIARENEIVAPQNNSSSAGPIRSE